MNPPDDMEHPVDLYDSTLGDIVDNHPPLWTKEMPRRLMLYGAIGTYKLQRETEGIVNGCGSGPVCVFIIKCSRSVKFTLKSESEYYNKKI